MQLLLSTILCSCFLAINVPGQSQSSLESEPEGWIDLLADASMKDWIRGPLSGNRFARAGDMNEPSPWKLDPAGKVLLCEGDKSGHEWLRYAPELSDFIFHVEFRFAPIPGETRYNSGVFVRTSADGKIWLQAQTTPEGGFLFGNTIVNGAPQMVNLRDKMSENRMKAAGEWNVYEIRASGRQITLWVNGTVVSEFHDCEVAGGYVGIEAEGYRVEFRNVRLKRLP